jgi:hypothetical protein
MQEGPTTIGASGTAARRMARTSDYVLAAALLVSWLVPIVWKGLTQREFMLMPHPLRDLHNVACLFTNRVGAWYQHYIGVKHVGSPRWRNVPMDELSRHNPFGYRSRIDWYLEGDPRTPEERSRYEHLSEWVKNRYERMHPDLGKVAKVRIYRAHFPVGSDQLALPDGHWVKPPPETVHRDNVRVLHEQVFVSEPVP